MKKYTLFSFLLLLFFLTACDKKVDFIYADRKQIPAKLKLTEVKNDELGLEQYEYDQQGRLSKAMIKGGDHYQFSYRNDRDSLPYQVNDVALHYKNDKLFQVISKSVTAELNYAADRMVITQIRKRPVATTLPDYKDTLVLHYNGHKQIVRTALTPAGRGLQFSIDGNATPYANIRNQMLALALIYPLEEAAPQLVMLLNNRNLLRFYQLSLGQTEGVEQLKTTDMSYRFDQPLYDVPTYMETFGAKTARNYYYYEVNK